MGSAIRQLTTAYAIASAAGALSLLAVTGQLETIALGLLIPLFALPSLILFIGLERFRPNRRWRHGGFWGPASGFLIYLLIGVAIDWAGYMNEGSGLPAVVAITFAAATAASYLYLVGTSKKQARR
jgi:hypothetical protein